LLFNEELPEDVKEKIIDAPFATKEKTPEQLFKEFMEEDDVPF